MSVRRTRPGLAFLLLAMALAGSIVLALASGPSGFGFFPQGERDPALAWVVVMKIRLPRIALAALVGTGLGAAGAVMQGMFRNPLADPGLIGVSSGAALGAALMITEGGALFGTTAIMRWGIPAGGFAGAFLMTGVLHFFSIRGGRLSTNRLILAGVALGALAGALTGIFVYRANDAALRDLTFWTMGSVAGGSWPEIEILTPFLCIAVLMLVLLSRSLNLLLAGEDNAALMGCHVTRVKWLCLLAVTLAVGPSVAFSGVIGFIGVVVPHLVRLICGPDHRVLIPGSALLGAILLVLSDMIARLIATPADVPVGIVTAALGAPVFIWLLIRTRDHELPS